MTRLFALVALAVAGVGCRLLPVPAPTPALHDFGPRRADSAAGMGVTLGAVEAPSWIDTTDIHYRLLYDEPQRLRAYGDNRWVAPPAALVESRMRALLARTGPPAASAVHVALVVEAFEQEFPSAGKAVAVVRLRATAHADGGEGAVPARPMAMRVVEVRREAGSDYRGAVAGLADAADAAIGEVLAWVAGSGTDGGPAGR